MRTTADSGCRIRFHGTAPYTVVAVHGGPGAAGEMAPVAAYLADRGFGVLEPFQEALSVSGQVEELASCITLHADAPVSLIGFSWGAWLGLLLCARRNIHVRKLILIGTPGFEPGTAPSLQKRLSRLNGSDREEAAHLMSRLSAPAVAGGNRLFARLGELLSKADGYAAGPDAHAPSCEYRYDIFTAVWREAVLLRDTGAFPELLQRVRCPVTAIHGDHDPHAAAAVEQTLRDCLASFSFHLLKRCGHKPWAEPYAKQRFFDILLQECTPPPGPDAGICAPAC